MQSKLGQVLRLWLLAGALAGFLCGGAQAQGTGGRVLRLIWDGPLTPPLLTYLERGLAQAQAEAAPFIILQLNTPGGQLDLMEKVVAQLRNSATPVVVYVAPRGAMAGSAGTLITLAGHVAAMAPETAIGAASPVGGQGEDLGTTLEAKQKEATMALARGLAERRGPAAVRLAEATIDTAEAVTASEALEAGLIDFIAVDLPDLLRQVDEFAVQVGGQPRTLLTRGLIVADVNMTWVELVLNQLTNPNIVFFLLSLGGLLIYVELQTPGGWVAGFLGAVCLTLAFYGLGVLPVNWFGLAFIVMAFVLFGIDLYAPSHGGLTLAGMIALIVGALVLFNSPGSLPFFRVNVPLVVGTAVVLGGTMLALLTYALRTIRRPALQGAQTLVGQPGVMRSPESAQVAGELWTVEPAERGQPLQPGDAIEVAEVKGLRLRVRKSRS
ncbi:MAG: nodulation protein NfeD [Anaerolineales bacterium]|nr:nodulation protein NfeD [Anaerolineales bacterium]